jgi:transcriptional regulator with XRE-family HTH domain
VTEAAMDGWGHRLREVRRRWRLSQAELAEAAGVSENAVRSWERNRRAPSHENALRVLQALRTRGVPEAELQWLLEGGSPPTGVREPMQARYRATPPGGVLSEVLSRLHRIEVLLEGATTRRRIPIVSLAACGRDRIPDDSPEILDYVPVPDGLPASARAVRAVGDSMGGLGILDRDVLIVLPGNPPQSGAALGIIRREGGQAECKLVYASVRGLEVWEWPWGGSPRRIPEQELGQAEWLARVLYVLRPEASVLSRAP